MPGLFRRARNPVPRRLADGPVGCRAISACSRPTIGSVRGESSRRWRELSRREKGRGAPPCGVRSQSVSASCASPPRQRSPTHVAVPNARSGACLAEVTTRVPSVPSHYDPLPGDRVHELERTTLAQNPPKPAPTGLRATKLLIVASRFPDATSHVVAVGPGSGVEAPSSIGRR